MRFLISFSNSTVLGLLIVFPIKAENIGKTINSPRTVELENEIKKRIGTKSNAFYEYL